MKYKVNGILKGKRVCFYFPDEDWAKSIYEKKEFTSMHLLLPDGKTKLLFKKENV